ncbi:MAG: hypothetical protein KatS3mg011_1120 [Acidimicrobiia bacterium]|nr:MAG: hypothetical protein KatS3mg011_1120 [Acidimicrobiia bacterium]
MTGRLHFPIGSRAPVPGLRREEGWVDMEVRFLLGEAEGLDDFLLGWTVMPPGARHDRHLHRNADEFFILVEGSGVIYLDEGEEPAVRGDVIWTPRGRWHGFHNTGDRDAVLVWGWRGAGSLEASGYQAWTGEER